MPNFSNAGNKAHSYEKGENGLFYVLSFGRRSKGSKSYTSEHEIKKVVADLEEESRQCDEDDARYSKIYHY